MTQFFRLAGLEKTSPVSAPSIRVDLDVRRGLVHALIEQNFRFAQTVADRHCIVHEGLIVETFGNDETEDNLGKLHSYLGV